MAWKLTTAAWAALGASLAGATAVGVGIALRKRRDADRPLWYMDAADLPPRIKLGRGPRGSPAQRLQAALTAWALVADTSLKRYTAAAAESYQIALLPPTDRPIGFGIPTIPTDSAKGLLWAVGDYPARPCWDHAIGGVNGSLYARDAWQRDPERVIRRAQGLVSHALTAAALYAQGSRSPLLGDDDPGGPTAGQLAEDYAREEAISYLVSTIPGGGVALDIGRALGGADWNYGMAERQSCDWATIAAKTRDLAHARAADLVAFAFAHP